MAAQTVKTKEIEMGKTNFTAEPGKQEVIVTRLFDVPRERLFKAMTDPKLIPQWWGPAFLTTVVEKMDCKPGGSWRYVQKESNGNVYAFHGVYHQVAAPEQLVCTFEYEDESGHVALETITLEDVNGKTLLHDQLVFQSVEDRDGMVQSGMEGGNTEGMDRLAALVATL